MSRGIDMMVGHRVLLFLAAVAIVSSSLTSCGHTEKYSISGQVFSGGSGLAGVTMTLSGADTGMVTTDASGAYTFSDLGNGSYTITPNKTGFAFNPTSSAHTINDADITTVNFTAISFPTFSISGTATSGIAGLANVTMMLSGAGSGMVTTDAGGTYTFSGLGNGSYTITPSKTGFIFNPASSSQTLNGKNVTAVHFNATAVSTLSIFGTVTSGGSGFSGVTMTLSGAGSATATTDASGNYIFSGLTNSRYTITPSNTGFTFSPTSSSQTLSGANVTGFNFTAMSTQAQTVACPSSGTANVTIQDYSFTPPALTINVNRIVKWTNNGPSVHTVTSGTAPNKDGKFDSGSLGAGANVCVQFMAAGVYPYFSTLDTSMTGSVTVN
jgi:plastocyanin